MKVIARFAPVLVFLGTFALYLSTLAPGMLRGDSGEFQWAMASLNVAHATGYPLFTLLGFGWHLLPLSNNVAWQLNLLAPFFGTLAVTTLFLFLRDLTKRLDAALVGALFFAVAPVMWFNASILEVYSLHAFLLALLFYLLWRWSRTPNENAPLYLAFFVLGLAIAHHRLIVLALPALLYFLLATDRRFFLNWRRLLICALLVVPGLLLYVYVPLRLVPSGFTFEYAFYDIILGREYAGSLLQQINPLPVLVTIPLDNFHIGTLLAVLGAITLFRRDLHLNIALLLVYLVDVVFALVYSVPDVQVFLTSSFVVTAIWIGCGVAFLLEWVATRASPNAARLAALVLAVVLVVAAVANVTRYTEIQTAVAAEAGPEARARAIAAMDLPENTSLELDWETATALRFLQSTEQLRPDLEARLIDLNHRESFRHALYDVSAGHPVLVERGVDWSRAPAGFVTEERGNDLKQILHVSPTMTPLRAAVNEKVELVGYSSTPDAITLYWHVLQPLGTDVSTFVHYLDAQGEKIGQDDRAACCEAVYGYRTGEWEAGQVYADTFKPAPDGTRSLLVGMYENNNGDIEPYGDTVTIELE